MRFYSNWLKAYMEYTEHSEAPDSFHFWTGVSTIAGALRRQVWIDQAYFQWTPNFYIILVAPPGIVSKSTTMGIGMKLLRQIEDVQFGPDSITWQALIQYMSRATKLVEMPDGTFHPMSCITIASSEFGTLLNPQDKELVDVMTSLWDGQISPFEKATKTQGNDKILNPWINIIAATTPAWISGNFPEYMIGGGFTSRCVLVYGEKKRKLVAYPGDNIPANFKEQEKKLVHDLEIISMLKGEFKLSREAKLWGEAWYKAHYEQAHSHMANSLDGYLSRKQTHIHKLAMVISASQRDDLIVSKEDLEAAASLITSLERDMHRVFGRISKTPASQNAVDVVEVIKRYREITRSNLFKLVFSKMSYQQFIEALDSAAQAGYIKIYSNGPLVKIQYIEDNDNA